MSNKDKKLHTISNFYLNSILNKYIDDFSPSSIIRNEHGKPAYLNNPLSFNLSHSGESFALLVTDQKSCGLDIQEVKKMDPFQNALRSVLTDREYEILYSNGAEEKFFQLWSLKEAFIKALGESIWLGRDYDFSSILPDYSNRWFEAYKHFFYSEKLSDKMFMSIALPHGSRNLEIYKL